MARTRDLGLTPFDELFETDQSRQERQKEKIEKIPLELIDPFLEHPFQVRKDEAMHEMAESIRQFGVLTPAVVRPVENGRYEMVSGHRRMCACEIAGLTEIPAIVRNMSRDDAILFMVDSNLQREHILPSEKAFSYKLRLEAMKRQGQRTDLTSGPLGQRSNPISSRDELANEVGDSSRQVHRYIRLTELIPPLLDMVDEGKVAFRPAVELSYLPIEEQMWLLDAMECESCTPSLAQAIKLKRFSQEGRLGQDVIFSILQEEKPNQVEQFKIPREKISRFFSPGTSREKMEETIVKALEFYRKRQKDMER